ncbi:hypothetical protein EK21DRAFT_111087 [Setomelanomma holmii]|uniref:SET domain-containing protein n=1 Tax=Setomelanomma holmii TaxID=210430 RepID=A0A9P4LP10_9PLEO|nr:hypothetical protein EK21DRAFT_111087 [Setomelanomma holmii]
MSQVYRSRETLVDKLIALQAATPGRAYSILHRLDLAKVYRRLGYPDLAAGDAYKALLLIDEVIEEGEYHHEALEAATQDKLSTQVADMAIHVEETEAANDPMTVANWARNNYSLMAYDVLIGCLLDCRNFRSAFEYLARAMKAFPGNAVIAQHDTLLRQKAQTLFEADGKIWDETQIDACPDKGFVRREQYPWNEHEPNRFSKECLQLLNEQMANVAPKLEVKIAELPLLSSTPSKSPSPEVQYVKQLGVFALEDISPGELILVEKSMLTAIARLHETYCDACSLPLPKGQDTTTMELAEDIQSCEECEEVFFCSTECHDLAQDSYHPSSCGVDVDQARLSVAEAADALYTSLLIRALALADTQGLHPLDLKELRYIWGDYHGLDLDELWRVDADNKSDDAFGAVPQTLPFSFTNNVLIPLHMLEKMDVNIFTQSDRYDTWVFNTIYAKLRGTASARQGLDGKPEIGAVHPMWCLTNHSCNPNVAWEWNGRMRFWTREKLVEWEGRDANVKPGLKKGEEVLSHYCDVRLPVQERREWAAGALGGDCVCSRCIWEATQEHRA